MASVRLLNLVCFEYVVNLRMIIIKCILSSFLTSSMVFVYVLSFLLSNSRCWQTREGSKQYQCDHFVSDFVFGKKKYHGECMHARGTNVEWIMLVGPHFVGIYFKCSLYIFFFSALKIYKVKQETNHASAVCYRIESPGE